MYLILIRKYGQKSAKTRASSNKNIMTANWRKDLKAVDSLHTPMEYFDSSSLLQIRQLTCKFCTSNQNFLCASRVYKKQQ